MPKDGSGLRLRPAAAMLAPVVAIVLLYDGLKAYVGRGRSLSAEVARPSTPPGPLPIAVRPRSADEGDGANRELPPRVRASYEGLAAPGSSIALRGEVSGGFRHVRWAQTRGPLAVMDDPTSLNPSIRVPDQAELLGFVLFASNDRGTDVASIEIRVSGPGRPGLKADAGDDQVGIVGRQVTLNGVRSEPRGQLAYRWLQVSGPRVRLEMEDGYIYAFVPQAPGVYQFGLVVGRGDAISKPDLVTVSVGNPSTPFGVEPSREAPEALHEVARAALGSVPGGVSVGPALGEAFDGIADRMDLYRSYDEAFSELGRRLEPLLPSDPARRSLWDERLFVPLTARLIDGMRGEGLDLRQADAPAKALTSGQRARLAELFRSMSQGFHATRPGP